MPSALLAFCLRVRLGGQKQAGEVTGDVSRKIHPIIAILLLSMHPLTAQVTPQAIEGERLFDDKMVDALKTSIPKKAGCYSAITQFECL